MTVERALRLIAGAFVALSVLLGIYVNANFLWFTLFVGSEPIPVRVYELVSDDGDPPKGRPARRPYWGRQSHLRDNTTVVARTRGAKGNVRDSAIRRLAFGAHPDDVEVAMGGTMRSRRTRADDAARRLV